MKIVVALDSFKGSMLSSEASEMVRNGLLEVNPNVQVVNIPIADGGEGTVDAILSITGGKKIFKQVEDPLGRMVNASFGWIPDQVTAVVEMAAASGLPLLTAVERNPYLASTYGTGQLVKSALDQGAEKIILGLGGSATVDAGIGFFQALGVKFLNEFGDDFRMSSGHLADITDIDVSAIDPRLKNISAIIASDVSNPLLGEKGAISVFGPQKGVKLEEIPKFEDWMEKYAEVVQKVTQRTCIDKPGSGAAGGVGFSLQSFLDVEMINGFTLISEMGQLEKQIQSASLVITGEGKMDTQSLYGKAPVGIARLAKKYNVPVVAFTGKIAGDLQLFKQEGLSILFPIVDEPITLEEAMYEGNTLLFKASKRLMELIEFSLELKKH